MPHRTLRTGCAAVLSLLLTVPANAAAAAPRHAHHTVKTRKAVTSQDQPINRRFASLDAYLANLELLQKPVGGPWYREVSPGQFELQTGGHLQLDVPDTSKKAFTRHELEQKFGFAK